MHKKIVGVIPARMASTRFYGKPLAKILGKEMIKWVYENSRASSILKELYVATDHVEIEEFCKREKMPCVMTSSLHKNCSERSNEVCQRFGADFVVEIQGDEPTLTSADIDDFINKAFEYERFDVATQYTDLTFEQAKDEHNVKLVVDKNSRALFFSRCPIPYNLKSQPVRYYKQVGLFLWPAEAIKRFSETPKSYLESIEDTHMLRLIENHFDVLLVYTPKYTVGVDVAEDIKEAEGFLKSSLKKQKYKMEGN